MKFFILIALLIPVSAPAQDAGGADDLAATQGDNTLKSSKKEKAFGLVMGAGTVTMGAMMGRTGCPPCVSPFAKAVPASECTGMYHMVGTACKAVAKLPSCVKCAMGVLMVGAGLKNIKDALGRQSTINKLENTKATLDCEKTPEATDCNHENLNTAKATPSPTPPEEYTATETYPPTDNSVLTPEERQQEILAHRAIEEATRLGDTLGVNFKDPNSVQAYSDKAAKKAGHANADAATSAAMAMLTPEEQKALAKASTQASGYSVTSIDAEGGGSGGGHHGGSGDDDMSGLLKNMGEENRGPANVNGLSINIGGDAIGVAGSNIFETVNRQYQTQSSHNRFLPEEGSRQPATTVRPNFFKR